jgi:hypothetical protein
LFHVLLNQVQRVGCGGFDGGQGTRWRRPVVGLFSAGL